MPKSNCALLLVLGSIALAGCGTKTHTSAPDPAKLAVTPAPRGGSALRPPTTFPGRPLSRLTVRSSELARSSARVLLRSEDGSVELIAGRSRSGRLCAGAVSPLSGETTVRCLRGSERPPLIGFISFTGRQKANLSQPANRVAGPPVSNPAKRHRLGVNSASVVGLADPSTDRVVLVLQDFSRRSVKLKRIPGLPWRVFSAGPYKNMASDPSSFKSLPSSLIAFDRSGRKLDEVELSWGYPHCQPDLCNYRQTKTGNWVIVRDPVASQQSPQISPARERQATRLLFSNTDVLRIISGRQYSLGAFGYWQKCNGESIGVIADVLLAYPVSIRGTLPYTAYRNGTGSAYLEGSASLVVDSLRELHVGIDLNRKRVVSIEPSAIRNGAVTSIRPIGKLHPAGGRDTANCGTGD